MSNAELKLQCSVDPFNTAAQCRKRYLGALRALRKRLMRTTNMLDGNVEYIQDMNKLEQFKQHLLQAGLGHIHSVTYDGAVATPQSV